MIKVGDQVYLPTPLQDRVDAAGGDLSALAVLERQMLPFEAQLASEPAVVVSVDDGWAMVDRGSFGQFGEPVDMLRPAEETPEECVKSTSFFAHTAIKARSEARRAGWLVNQPGGKDFCPDHRPGRAVSEGSGTPDE